MMKANNYFMIKKVRNFIKVNKLLNYICVYFFV